jgi:hypothetical protein
LKAIGRAAAATKIAVAHRVVEQLLALDEKRRERGAASLYNFGPHPLFESPYEKRRLRILNAVFLTLERRGHRARFDRRDDDVTFSVRVGDIGVGVELEPWGRRSTPVYGRRAPDPGRSADEKLELTAAAHGSGTLETWKDDASGALESKIAQIAAGIIVAGEAGLRAGLRKQAEQAERGRIEAARRAEALQKEMEEKRIESLLRSGQLLAEAQHLRSVIASVEAAVAAGGIEISVEGLARWKVWAESQADAVDPVKSGQIFEHLQRSR